MKCNKCGDGDLSFLLEGGLCPSCHSEKVEKPKRKGTYHGGSKKMPQWKKDKQQKVRERKQALGKI